MIIMDRTTGCIIQEAKLEDTGTCYNGKVWISSTGRLSDGYGVYKSDAIRLYTQEEVDEMTKTVPVSVSAELASAITWYRNGLRWEEKFLGLFEAEKFPPSIYRALLDTYYHKRVAIICNGYEVVEPTIEEQVTSIIEDDVMTTDQKVTRIQELYKGSRCTDGTDS